MDREKTIGKLAALRSRAAEALQKALGSVWLQKSASAAIGLLMATASLASGVSPFGLAYAATAPHSALGAAAGAFFGYMLAQGTQGLAYCAAVLVVLTCRTLFRGTRLSRSVYFTALYSSVALLFTRSAVVLHDGGSAPVLLLCECALCAGFCVFYSSARQRIDRRSRLLVVWGRAAALASVLLAARSVMLFGAISLSRSAACLAVICMSVGGADMGALAGVAFGAVMDIAYSSGPFFVCIWGFAGLMSGFCRGSSRLRQTMCFVAANAAATLWGRGNPCSVPGLYECFIASVSFIALPLRLSAPLETGLAQPVPAGGEGQRLRTAGKLRSISDAIGRLGAAVAAPAHAQEAQRSKPELSSVFSGAAGAVCRKCPRVSACWQDGYIDTKGALNDVSAALRRRNFLELSDFPAPFASRCMRLTELCGEINHRYRSSLLRSAGQARENRAMELISGQYESLRSVLRDMAGSVTPYPEYYPELCRKVQDIASAYCRGARAFVYSDNGRMHIEVHLPREPAESFDSRAFLGTVSRALGKSFLPPSEIPDRSGAVIRISECERFAASVSCAVRKKHGESVCGDSSMHLHTEDGRAVVMLSDGMGTGEAAQNVSRRALELIASFVSSGCSLEESCGAVLPVLNAGFEQSGFVTLDLLEIDLFSGGGKLLKYGASPSFLLRGGSMRRICGEAMPAGIENVLPQDSSPAVIKFSDGDRLVMLSDGVWDSEGIEAVLRTGAALEPPQLAAELINAASRGGSTDDMTVMIVRVNKRI